MVNVAFSALRAQMAAPAALQGHVVPPLATAAQLQAIVAGLPAMIQAAVQAAIAPMQAQLAALQAAIAPMQAQLAALAPADMASTVVRIADARRFNCGRRLAFRIVPCDNGADPVNWPHGLTYALVMGMTHAALNALLPEYSLPIAGTLAAKRNQLLEHIGFYSE